jgi:hypothetical protein
MAILVAGLIGYGLYRVLKDDGAPVRRGGGGGGNGRNYERERENERQRRQKAYESGCYMQDQDRARRAAQARRGR